MKYSDVSNEILEDAFTRNVTEVEIDDGYIVNVISYFQYNKRDKEKKWLVKCIPSECDHTMNHQRQDRFSLPVIQTFTQSESRDTALCLEGMDSLRFPDIYYRREVENTSKTYADIVREAIQGILKEGFNVGKPLEAKWLARQLRAVRHFGAHTRPLYSDFHYRDVPDEIGQTCVYLYTKECFWYKLINSAMRNLNTITNAQLKTLGPFAYILDSYLHCIKTTNIARVYRGLDLTNEQLRKYSNKELLYYFTSFTSTTWNRENAEKFDGNTLFIIDLKFDSIRSRPVTARPCGANISSMSDFPTQEEFLIWPATAFELISHIHENNKHIVHFRLSRKKSGAAEF
ncbi:unnamed protein product [Adineta steineri]|uniref:NAD(P)(+)--arginine ADP-ribosyltransferase n=1 Tax=Adineta steineri TaxID=433720 RepID=A0A820E8Q3_9BILA|nr:unnamed protein product [Adineta steineri]CAF4244525.1 unnamed protein product [Adineta steineri]